MIRKAEEADLLAVVQLLADDQLGSQRENASSPLDPTYKGAFAQMSQQKGNDLYVAVENDKVVGCMQLTFIAGLSRKGMTRMQIEGVRISKEVRSSGLGQKMMEYAINLAKSSHCGLVQLTTDVKRPDAHRFYERLGFEASHVGMKLNLLKDR
ncbi:MAG: GNAT family N-acetyltransferase [Sneathiella sp.]